METFVRILLYLWQLPQNLLGLLLGQYYGGDVTVHDIGKYQRVRVHRSLIMRGGISLGNRVILYPEAGTATLMHEIGHCRQSLYLGWLYLIVIGLPSIVWAGLHSYCDKVRDRWSYYDFYTEAWADRLGGVER